MSGNRLGCTDLVADVGLLCSFLGERMDCERCRPTLNDSALKDFLTLVDLFAPYRDEKLSDGR